MAPSSPALHELVGLGQSLPTASADRRAYQVPVVRFIVALPQSDPGAKL